MKARSLIAPLAILLLVGVLALPNFFSGKRDQAQDESRIGLPQVERVDAQPLVLQVQRMAEAMQTVGAPLAPDEIKQLDSLKNLTTDSEATLTAQAIFDPHCIAAVEIAEDGKMLVTPTRAVTELEENGWRTFLVKVINRAAVRGRLRVESPNAQALPNALPSELASRWMGISAFDGRPLSTNLSGLGLEYRMIQISAIGQGTRRGLLEFNISGLPGQAATMIRQWRFDRDADGWGEPNHATLDAGRGSLIFHGTGADPFMMTAVQARAGNMKVKFFAMAEQAGIAELYWATKEKPAPDAVRKVSFPIHAGAAQEYEVEFACEGELSMLRIDPANGPGKVRFDWMDLSYARGDHADWTKVEMDFKTIPSTLVHFQVTDADGTPCMGAFEIRDSQGRIYPAQTKRIAPDFFFQTQIYRESGETLPLARGTYTIKCSHGPESLPEIKTLIVGEQPLTLRYQVKRWIDTDKFGYWSGDHHIHAAGCLHYNNPTQGVHPSDMLRHIMGEDVKVGSCLTWGPCFDYQKQFFTGKPADVSRYPYLLRYDIEVSGFGSENAGHLCLLNLKQQFPAGGDSMAHWPTLALSTLRWAKQQGAVVGTAHSAIGLSGAVGRTPGVDGPLRLPNYDVPPFDGIGAMEYIVDVTHQVPNEHGKMERAVDFLATMNSEREQEWNIWYHTLNCGIDMVVSGETDFPCMSGERVGKGRVYVKLDGKLDYDAWVQRIKQGRSYVSDGTAHLLDFARLQDGSFAVSAAIRSADLLEKEVELIVNGLPVARQMIAGDGTLTHCVFPAPEIKETSWVAVRTFPNAHSNPLKVVIDGKPFKPRKESAMWCLAAVDQCWKSKQGFYAPAEREAAMAAFDHAREYYRRLIAEASEP